MNKAIKPDQNMIDIMKEFNKNNKKMINMNFENEKDIFIGDTSTMYSKIINLKEESEKQKSIKVSLLF